jgi:hypothetical protein
MLGSLLAMPILVINMGGEMIYILHQRLQAQNITDDKARKVLEDVIRTMYTPVFLEELFKPQEMYSNSSTKQIFEKLAHSSIMRLNKQSMEKLYDLMSMGVKYQLLCCTCPQQYLQITLQHLDALSAIVQSDSVQPLLASAINRCINMYANLTQGNWLLLQQTILQFYQGRKVKVSLFLQQELQTMTGVLILKNSGKLPFNVDVPGNIRYYENGSIVNNQRFPTTLDGNVEESTQVIDHTSSLGKNMYLRPDAASNSRSAPASFRDAEAAFSRQMESSGASHVHQAAVAKEASPVAMPKSVSATSDTSSKKGSAGESSAKAELSVLAELLGGGGAGSSKAEGKNGGFRINLVESRSGGFAKGDGDGKGIDDVDNDGDDSFVISIDIDASIGAKTVESYMRDLDLRDDAKAERKSAADDEDDLLALMDSAK